jgi:glycosyltransferase involved in cell wall biosynthesis
MRLVGQTDLVISTSHCVAKGFITPDDIPHFSYIHSPMRYVWDMFDEYFAPGRAGLATRLAMRAVRGRLQRWDRETAGRVDEYWCNSRHIAAKISTYYERKATVLPPPVDTGCFWPAPPEAIEAARVAGKLPWLVASALVSYKRLDLAIRAVQQTGGRLIVVGRGPEAERLAEIAGPETEFRGWVGDDELAELNRTCRAFLFPGEEDFGITPLEAMASGRPVVAYGRGGALETVVEGVTGVFFHEQTAESMAAAMRRAEAIEWDAAAIRRHAEGFSRAACRERFDAAIRAAWATWQAGRRRAGAS